MFTLDAIWEDIYGQLKELFPDAPRVVIHTDARCRIKRRHFADVDVSADPVVVRVHPELHMSLQTRIQGILSHEAGHILDFLLVDDDLFSDICQELGVQYSNDDERRADILAEWLTGWRIFYDSDNVQRAGVGAKGKYPRPHGLH